MKIVSIGIFNRCEELEAELSNYFYGDIPSSIKELLEDVKKELPECGIIIESTFEELVGNNLLGSEVKVIKAMQTAGAK